MTQKIISHSIYLTPQERKLLASEPTTIETVGISVPPKSSDIKLTEVFVRYLITTEMPNDKNIELMPNGYKISFASLNSLKPITNVPEGGSEWLLLEIDNEIEKDGKIIPLHHQIVFKDVSVQERTTICNQLGHFLKMI